MLVENKFEDLIFWQKARELARNILMATREPSFKHNFELGAQIERYAMSIMADIAEGSSCDQRQDYENFLYSAIGAASGFQSYLYLALDLRCITQSQFEDYYGRVVEIVHLIDSYAARLQEGRRPSPRHHKPS